MKPIRIYADDTVIGTKDFYVWGTRYSCTGGNGCHNCLLFSNLNCQDQTSHAVATYRPTTDYIELTVDSHPEIFL